MGNPFKAIGRGIKKTFGGGGRPAHQTNARLGSVAPTAGSIPRATFTESGRAARPASGAPTAPAAPLPSRRMIPTGTPAKAAAPERRTSRSAGKASAAPSGLPANPRKVPLTPPTGETPAGRPLRPVVTTSMSPTVRLAEPPPERPLRPVVQTRMSDTVALAEPPKPLGYFQSASAQPSAPPPSTRPPESVAMRMTRTRHQTQRAHELARSRPRAKGRSLSRGR